MRVARLMLTLVLVLPTVLPAAPPVHQTTQTSTASPSPTTILQQSLAALVGNTQLSDITLSGTVRRIAGSDDETGSATLQAVSNGSARLQLSLSAGTWTETYNLFDAPAGSWSGPDSVSHPQALHNLFAEPAWFSPAIAIERRLSSPGFVVAYVDHETLNGESVEHVSVSHTTTFPDPSGGPTYAHLSQVDFYLDSTTLRPAAISFNTHPDKNSLIDLPVQILFSDYRSVSGVQIPFHVQKFLNNNLLLDLQLESVSANTGLSASTFNIQ